MKILLFIFLAFVFIVFAYIIFKSKTTIKRVTINNTPIEAEVADTTLKRIKGLMFRESLEKEKGMLFLFDDDGYHGIWMMNMKFPIDIIWIDSDHKIVDIVKNAQPCKVLCPSYKPKEKARYVIEVNAGFTDRHSIKIVDKVKIY
jgi:hypothetical protein